MKCTGDASRPDGVGSVSLDMRGRARDVLVLWSFFLLPYSLALVRIAFYRSMYTCIHEVIPVIVSWWVRIADSGCLYLISKVCHLASCVLPAKV